MPDRIFVREKAFALLSRIISEDCVNNPNLDMNSLRLRANFIAMRINSLNQERLDEASLEYLDRLIDQTNEEIDGAIILVAQDVEIVSNNSGCFFGVGALVDFTFNNIANFLNNIVNRNDVVCPQANEAAQE